MKHLISILTFIVAAAPLHTALAQAPASTTEQKAVMPVPSLTPQNFLQQLRADSRVVLSDGTTATDCRLELSSKGQTIQATLANRGKAAVKVREVIFFDGPHGWPAKAPIYAEGFQLLSQTGGTLEKPVDLGDYTDRAHYKIPEPDGLRTVYGVMTVTPGAAQMLMGFTSCHRFAGRFGFDGTRLRISQDCENLELAPGQKWRLEEMFVTQGKSRSELLNQFAGQMEKVQPRLPWKTPPTGWSSWIAFGPNVTEKDVNSNLDWMAKNMPQLRYIQIDDGYQPWMGDWLETRPGYGKPIQNTLHNIAEHGFEPALWVAPFVASPQSKLFKEHPDWFVKDDNGAPLPSNKIGFGGWRLGPWYALDGTHPEAQKWLTHLFRTMREEWGVKYFKLDGNYWGTMHGGHHFDPHATRIEAYRRGMQAIIKGAGDAFILGCNQPMWASVGVVHGSRTSMDVARSWISFRNTGRENLLRSWQNGHLWWTDPDSLLLFSQGSIMDASGVAVKKGAVSDDEVLFHATLLYATGGMLLCGDNMPGLSPRQVEWLRKVLPPTGHPFEFSDESLTWGKLSHNGHNYVVHFNWSDVESDRQLELPKGARARDSWTGEIVDITATNGQFKMAPHTARLLEIVR